ncbi:MAG: F0F1 ATP synthase subunit gamma [Deltaproteobacteria bacterium]|nr:F0F1 ATP synthase subunit gamma [Deltaproteobacteria bacterium]
MASLKDVKMKISGVGKTKQITKAMHMVSSAKLRGAQQRIERFRPYADKFQELLANLSAGAGAGEHPLLAVRPEPKTCCIILVTSDRGLCGGFNSSLAQKALKLAGQKRDEGRKVYFVCIGRKGRDSIRISGFDFNPDFVRGLTSFTFQAACQIGGSVIDGFLEEKLDEVYLVYAKFVSTVRHEPTTLGLLPMKTPESAGGATGGGEKPGQAGLDYLYEPDVETLLAEILPKYLNAQIYRGLLDTSASEHAARMAAMDNATRNCDEIIKNLTLLYNKNRQASITRELIDIVSGADALK